MKKLRKIAGGMILGLLILGAGCADQGNDQPEIKDAGASTVELNTKSDTPNKDSVTIQPAQGVAIITLKGEAVGSGNVNFSWNTTEKMDESNSLILLRSANENPEHTGKNNWYRLHYAKTDIIWGNQPAGNWHYRICITPKDNKDTCMFYSNDAQVDVK